MRNLLCDDSSVLRRPCSVFTRNRFILLGRFELGFARDMVTTAIVEQYREFVRSKFRDINSEAANLIQTARAEIEQEIKDLDDSVATGRAQLIAAGHPVSSLATVY